MSVQESFDFVVQWHLTERCNLQCTHCYQKDTIENELSLPQIKDTIAEIAALFAAWKEEYDVSFSPSFNITGGEPFLRKDLFEILYEIKRYGYEIHLLTNGTLIDEQRARKLQELGIPGVQVSLEGPEKIHDLIRGQGSFSSSIRGIEFLLAAGLPVTVNTTLSELNAEHFRELAHFSQKLGVQRLGYSRLVPSGRGAGLLDSMLPKARVRDLYREISAFSFAGLELVTGDPVAKQIMSSVPETRETDDSIAVGGCSAGIAGLTFLSDGTIVPCRRLQVPIGNLTKDSLREVWASSPVLELLRDRSKYTGKCGSCRRWSVCRGCRAIAYAYAQSKGLDDFLAEDPQCFIDE